MSCIFLSKDKNSYKKKKHCSYTFFSTTIHEHRYKCTYKVQGISIRAINVEQFTNCPDVAVKVRVRMRNFSFISPLSYLVIIRPRCNV